MKNPLVLVIGAGAVLIAGSIVAGAMLLRSPMPPPVDPIVPAITSGQFQQVEDMGKALEGAKKTQAKVMMGILDASLREYQLQVGEIPSSLKSLHELPSDLIDKNLWVQKLDKPVPSDPWGNPYEYSRSEKAFKLRSNGPDGKPETIDDIEYKR
ncbi:MAG: type II secretion system protein GspG [Pirellula sp.]